MWHCLLNEITKDGQEHEDGEQLVLQSLNRGRSIPEREADEETL